MPSQSMQYCQPTFACIYISYAHLNKQKTQKKQTVDGAHLRDHDAERVLPFAADDLVRCSLLKARVRL